MAPILSRPRHLASPNGVHRPGACAQRRPRAPRGRARAQARARTAAPGQARDRRHLPRDAHRSRDPAPAHARVPGRRPRRGAHRRRLHDQDRRPVGPVLRAAGALRRGDRRERRALLRAGEADHRRRPGAARGALQRRMAARARLRRGAAPDPNGHRGALARARRLRQALRGECADLGLRAPLPAHAGLRLGRGPGRRRAGRHRPALQPARRAATSWRPTASSPRSP